MKNLLLMFAAVLIFASCSNNANEGTTDVKVVEKAEISAAGATFPLPFYNIAFKNYAETNNAEITYGGIGSGGGIRSLKDKVVDFGATDAFLDEEKEAEMPAAIVHIPTCIGAVVIAYNLPGIESLSLSSQNLEDIFMGNIKNWNDAKLAETNPDVTLPNMEISLIHRSDGSGTTYIFSDYMSKISTKWEAEIGRGKSLNWPVGMGAKGNPGVAGTIQQTEGSIGYIGSEFAFAQKISFAKLENASGNYIEPSIASISASAQGDIPTDTKVMLTNSSDPNAYPICGFTWLIIYKDQKYDGRTLAQAEATVKLLSWMIEKDAQAIAQQVQYAPLPEKAVTQAKAILGSVVYEGVPVLK